MLFNSVPFLIFFPIVVTAYFLCPPRFRWALLLGASYYFYMQWVPEYALLILASTLIDYFACRSMAEIKDKKSRRPFLLMSLTGNLGMLFFFKYYNFFNRTLGGVLPMSELLLPVGISFYTFQTMSYSIDVYRGRVKHEGHFGRFALYVAYFPQLVAGPIERAKSLLPQLQKEHRYDYERVKSGLQLMAWGMFKKVCVADRLSMYTKPAFEGDPAAHTGAYWFLVTVFFCIQVYCDFSGYSDIAIGAAKVMGIDLMENFRRPFFSRNIEELWRRWHMSLVGWLNEYLYQPLAFEARRSSQLVKQSIVLFVFLVTGLWHGASWKFVAWGGINGLFVISHVITLKPRKKMVAALGLERVPNLHAGMSMAFTFSLFSLGAVFFAAKDFSAGLEIMQRIPTGWLNLTALKAPLLASGPANLLLVLAGVAILFTVDTVQAHFGPLRPLINRQHALIRWTLYYGVILWILLFGIFEREEFVYFQF